MNIGTKSMICIFFVGSAINALFLNNYKQSYELILVIMIVLITWYLERKK